MKKILLFFLLCSFLLPASMAQHRSVTKLKTLVIDPGHGGSKPGAVGRQAKEKDIVLSVALKFGKLVSDNYPDVKVVYTRSSDADIALSERARIANHNKADLFVSIHANSCPNSSPTGVETYVVGISRGKANKEVAIKENADIFLEKGYEKNDAYMGFDPNSPESSIIFSMFQNTFLERSLDFAGYLQDNYAASIRTVNRGVKQAEFMVLCLSAMPAVLTEIGFISNPSEEAYMMSDLGQGTIAVSLFNAFATYKKAQDGTPIPAKPVIDIPGYGINAPKNPSPKPIAVSSDTAPSNSSSDSLPAPSPASLVSSSSAPAPASASKPDSAAAPAPPSHSSLEYPVYRVQFLSADRFYQPGDRHLKGVSGFDTYVDNGSVRYLKGSFSSAQKAKALQDELRQAGFKDAFIVAFLNGVRISLQKAREILDELDAN